ncbi:MAG: FAD-dependent oxidoreductase, partial [Armatimonadota bacterium]
MVACLAQPAQEGLVAHWPLDEFQDGVTPDASGNGNDALVREGTRVKGALGAALQFGDETHARCTHSPELAPTGALTVEAWVRLDSPAMSGYPTVIRKEGSYALRFNASADRRLGLLLWVQGEPVRLTSAAAEWEIGRWHHLVGTFDGAAMCLFIDGTEDAGSPQQQRGPIDITMADVALGPGDGHGRFEGSIDEVRIYDRALTPEEIARRHRLGRESLLARADETMEPAPVGERRPTLRPPTREIRMVEAGFIWIETEDFDDYGGWQLDNEFVHLMGSPYLIAAGIGTPVEDATVGVELPRAGRWRLWARARDWLPDFSPGTFRVLVDGEEIGPVLGRDPSGQWRWQSLGEVGLSAGRHTLALHDLTGYYGRCDALLLTTDMGYTPPEELEALERERARLTGRSLQPKLVGEFDVIVVGAGVAGSCAALAAARHGASTALIDDRPVPGGNASRELGVPISGASCCHPHARESGIVEELLGLQARWGYPRMSGPIQRAVDAEPSLQLFLNQRVVDVVMADDGTIAAAKAVHTVTGEYSLYRGRVFIDCTGDGWVGFYAGAEYRFGREARSEFDESLAPQMPDEITMSGCIMGQCVGYRAEDAGEPVQYTPPPWAPKFESAERFGRNPRGFASGEWWLEHPGTIDDIEHAEEARDELIRITFGYWDYIKNVWPERERARNYRLAFVPIHDAKRESRRLVGDYILTQNDVQSARLFPDRISYGGWPLDVHHPEGIYSGPEGPFDFDPHVPIYSIPYRILYSRTIGNLLMAGRDVSVTHVALGSVRVQGTLGPLGQAAGTAAAMCIQHGTTPRGIYEQHITTLQQTLLRDDMYIPRLRNEDPDDLARPAAVTASSSMIGRAFGRGDVRPGDSHELFTSRATMLPCGADGHVGAVEALLRSELEQPAELTMHLRTAAESADFSAGDDLATATASVPPGQSWVRFEFGVTVDQPYLWFWLPQTEGVSWLLMESAPIGSCRA